MNARLTADYVIVGSGIAGLRAALGLVPHGRVIVLTKSDPDAGSTAAAQGGIAAAFGPDDSPSLHAADTLAAGAGLCDPGAVDVLVGEAPRYVQELIDWGAGFDRHADGTLALAREAAHSVRRVLHARDATGREIVRTLLARLRGHANLTLLDHATAIRILVRDGAACGVRFLDAHGRVQEALGAATLLATGGAGAVYRETTNPPVATGDGVALAYLAGARIADMEFVQFHPTALAVEGAPRYLMSEALRGEGAHLINRDGERFMSTYDAAAELAPRDRVARALVREAARTGGPVSLSLAHLDAATVRHTFPLLTELCARVGLDLACDPIPVAPAAHYLMGGVVTDLDGRTSVDRLFAAGEAACTGVHGANRLASNSLLEGLVFGARAAEAMRRARDAGTAGEPVRASSDTATLAEGRSPDEGEIRAQMWASAGIFRSRDGLEGWLAQFEPAWDEIRSRFDAGAPISAGAWRVASLLTVGRLIVLGALRREESRGAHSRTDFPERDDLHWMRHLEAVIGH